MNSTDLKSRQRPSVTLIIPNFNGKRHLGPCLDSVAALDYEPDLLEVVVVDNNSNDGSVEFVEREYPGIRVLRQRTNLGFAEAVNVAARSSDKDCIALANNDMRLESAWLSRLVASYAPSEGYPCVAGLILDWEGQRVDFVGGFVNFHGAAAQESFHEPLDSVAVEDGRELLFACGGSMLVERKLFVDLGGFDSAFFAYFEDVDFGWRLWLAGHKVRLAAGAVSFHRHHTTGSTFPMYQRALIFERNWLLMLIKNLDEPHVWRLLSAALLLLNQRVVLESKSRREAFDPGEPAAGDAARVPRIALARLHAVGDVVDQLPEVLERRASIQALRRRPDSEVFPLFNRPFAPVREDAPYLESLARVSQALGLAELFPDRKATRLFVAAPANDGRLWKLACEAARVMTVIYGTQSESDRSHPAIEFVELTASRSSRQFAAEADLVLMRSDDPALESVAEELHGLLLVDVASDREAPLSVDLADLADVIVTSSDQEREVVLSRLDHSASAPHVEVLPDGSEATFFTKLASEPWHWKRADARRGSAGVTEDTLALLTRWRHEYGVYRSGLWHLARAAWRLLPENIRVRLRQNMHVPGRSGVR